MKNSEVVNENIHVNQIGYRPHDKKEAIINGKDGEFSVIDEESGEIVFSGKAVGGASDEASGDTVYYGDFTSVIEPGTYYILMPDFGRSYSFKVDNHVYKEAKNSLLKALYFQRCGIALEEKHAGQWNHAACHLQKGKVYGNDSITLDGSGGWHDAGVTANTQ